MFEYAAMGLPVINLIDIRGLAIQNGIPVDPPIPPFQVLARDVCMPLIAAPNPQPPSGLRAVSS